MAVVAREEVERGWCKGECSFCAEAKSVGAWRLADDAVVECCWKCAVECLVKLVADCVPSMSQAAAECAAQRLSAQFWRAAALRSFREMREQEDAA